VGYRNRANENVLETPNIDRLSKEGCVLDNYYVQSTCTPSRSVLLTGKYQIHTGMQHSIVQSGHPHALGVEHPTIAEELKRAGYATHMVRTPNDNRNWCLTQCRSIDRSIHPLIVWGGGLSN
jgi:arylsulfatase A-like enzyme